MKHNKLKYLIYKHFSYIRKETQNFIKKDNVNAILFMFGLYTLGSISIIRADFLYRDDYERIFLGYHYWGYNSRHISDFLATLLHASAPRIADISPLTQLVALLFIAIASVLLVYIMSNGKVTKTACFLALPVGLSPYFIECLCWKFDSPYMGLSVLASIVPFLFMQNKIVFSLTSIITLLIMCMTYQASSGIYIIIAIMLCFKAWNERKKTSREIIRFAVISALSYCASISFYHLLLLTYTRYKRDVYAFPPIHELFPRIVNKFIDYMNYIKSDFGSIWKFLLFILCLTFVIASVLLSKRNKIAAFALSVTTIAAMCIMSYGVYLVVATWLFDARAMLGFGVFIACIAVYLSGIPRKIVLLPAVLLSWCFFVFSFTVGNALSEQKRYNNFRTEILLHDLSTNFPDRTEEPLLVKLVGSAGFAPSIANIYMSNHVIVRLVPRHLDGNYFWQSFEALKHYNFNLQSADVGEDGLDKIIDTYYHTIKTDGRRVLVILK